MPSPRSFLNPVAIMFLMAGASRRSVAGAPLRAARGFNPGDIVVEDPSNDDGEWKLPPATGDWTFPDGSKKCCIGSEENCRCWASDRAAGGYCGDCFRMHRPSPPSPPAPPPSPPAPPPLGDDTPPTEDDGPSAPTSPTEEGEQALGGVLSGDTTRVASDLASHAAKGLTAPVASRATYAGHPGIVSPVVDQATYAGHPGIVSPVTDQATYVGNPGIVAPAAVEVTYGSATAKGASGSAFTEMMSKAGWNDLSKEEFGTLFAGAGGGYTMHKVGEVKTPVKCGFANTALYAVSRIDGSMSKLTAITCTGTCHGENCASSGCNPIDGEANCSADVKCTGSGHFTDASCSTSISSFSFGTPAISTLPF